MNTEKPLDHLHQSTFWLAICCILLLTPFCVNNFLQGRTAMGVGSMLIVVIISFNGWLIRQNRFHHNITLLGLVPAIIVFLALAIRSQGIIGVLWCYPSLVALYMMLPERKAWIANIALIIITIPTAWYILDTPLAIRMIATLLAVSIFSAIFMRVITKQQEMLHDMAITDQLTGLLNRTLMQPNLDQAINLNNRSGDPMSIMIMDIDHFKRINDTYGHDAGDTVLNSVAELILTRLRRTDKVFRLGGEEFLALLYGTDTDNAEDIANTIRETIVSQAFILGEIITISIGVAGLKKGEDRSSWMKRCDNNLYQAKTGGRNRVVAS